MIPEKVLPHIGSVILPQNNPANIAMEMEWLEASMNRGQEKVHYIGAKDQVTQLQKIAKFKYSSSQERARPTAKRTAPIFRWKRKFLAPRQKA